MDIRVGILTAPKIEAEQRDGQFLLRNVRIGIGFHWDRHEDQLFEGRLEIRHNEDGTETAINTLDLEQYLTSVISSEMSADSPMELLKAHAVISRSWAVRMIERRKHAAESTSAVQEFHEHFDVCADDHCQRYEGLLRRNERALEAVRATAGQVLTYEGEVCDCRFHKCCGGRTEEYETCWEDRHIPYLVSVECPWCNPEAPSVSPLGGSDYAARFRKIQGGSDYAERFRKILGTALNNYDQETTDFHDWTVRYSHAELAEIIREKSGIDFGEILELRPLKRGKSGRIYSLEIVGTKHTEVIGKELKIRLWLSRKCLYSSWFEIQKTAEEFILSGHGWGHGAGLCQIGATVMAVEGMSYEQILAHYYPGTRLSRMS